jgi:WD40 repeat protein
MLLMGLCPALFSDHGWGQEKKLTFDDHVKPILLRRCSSCHNSDRTEGDLNVTNFIDLTQGGGSGEAIVPFSADESYLFGLVTHEDSPEMPPGGDKIPDPEIQLLKRWIDQGALENLTSVAKPKKPRSDLLAIAVEPGQAPDPLPKLPRLSLQPQRHGEQKSPIRSIAVNPWAAMVAIAVPRQVLLLDSETLKLKGILPFLDGNPNYVRFSRSGHWLLIAGGRGGAWGKVQLRDVNTGSVLVTLGDELDEVLAADISPDHQYVALGGPKKVVRVYSVSDRALQYEITDHTQWITAIEFSPDGRSLMTADRNGGLIITDVRSGSKQFTLDAHKQSVTGVAWRRDGKVLASVSEDKTLRIWSPSNGTQIKSVNAHQQGVTDVAFTTDGRILTVGRDQTVKRWKQNGTADGQFVGLGDIGMAVAWCGQSSHIFAGDWKGEVLVWKPDQNEAVAALDANPPFLEDRIAAVERSIAGAQRQLRSAQQVVDQTKAKRKRLQTQADAQSSADQDRDHKGSGRAVKKTQSIQSRKSVDVKRGREMRDLDDQIKTLRKVRDAKREILRKRQQTLKRWQDEAAFAKSFASEADIVPAE